MDALYFNLLQQALRNNTPVYFRDSTGTRGARVAQAHEGTGGSQLITFETGHVYDGTQLTESDFWICVPLEMKSLQASLTNESLQNRLARFAFLYGQKALAESGYTITVTNDNVTHVATKPAKNKPYYRRERW